MSAGMMLDHIVWDFCPFERNVSDDTIIIGVNYVGRNVSDGTYV